MTVPMTTEDFVFIDGLNKFTIEGRFTSSTKRTSVETHGRGKGMEDTKRTELTKLDLDLIFERGDGRPVPKEMDRHMVKYVLWQHKVEVENS
jgi:hypothetical protein